MSTSKSRLADGVGAEQAVGIAMSNPDAGGRAFAFFMSSSSDEEDAGSSEAGAASGSLGSPVAAGRRLEELALERARRRYDEEDPSAPSWALHKKHVFVLSSAGKPIFSRYGDESLLAPQMGMLQALISFVTDRGDTIRYIKAGAVNIVFIMRGAIYLVAVSSTGETVEHLWRQLGLLHGQIISILTSKVQQIASSASRAASRHSRAATAEVRSSRHGLPPSRATVATRSPSAAPASRRATASQAPSTSRSMAALISAAASAGHARTQRAHVQSASPPRHADDAGAWGVSTRLRTGCVPDACANDALSRPHAVAATRQRSRSPEAVAATRRT